MTRENKLALVVGFALILFVGILISDYFSGFQSQASADLNQGIKDPLAGARSDQPGLIDYQVLTHPTEMGAPNQESMNAPPSHDEQAIFMGGPVQSEPEVIGLDAAAAADLPFFYHQVRPDESLSSIARHHFGDPSLSTELAAFNGITNPNSLRAGRQLRIPRKPDVLLRGGIPGAPMETAASPPASNDTAPPPSAAAPTYASYTIKSGDVLSRLSQNLLGTTRRMNELIELNRDVIANPDRLIPGTVIKVPQD